jgi:hypothetical protein
MRWFQEEDRLVVAIQYAETIFWQSTVYAAVQLMDIHRVVFLRYRLQW